MCLMKCKSDPACVSVQVGETSVVNVDCSRAGPGQLSLEDALDSSPTSPTGSGNTTNIHTISCKLTYWWLYMFQPITYKSHTTFQVIHQLLDVCPSFRAAIGFMQRLETCCRQIFYKSISFLLLKGLQFRKCSHSLFWWRVT